MYHNITSSKWSIMCMSTSYIGFTFCSVKWYFPGVPHQIPLRNMYLQLAKHPQPPPFTIPPPVNINPNPWYSPQTFPNIKKEKHKTNLHLQFQPSKGGLLKKNTVPNRSPILAPQMPSFWKCNGALTAHA